MRYAYGVTAALLLGGTAFSLATGPVGAQVAQNAPSALAPRAGAPLSFADLAARLQPAVVNISTKQRVPVRTPDRPVRGILPPLRRARRDPDAAWRWRANSRERAKPARSARASSSRPTAMSSPTTT